MTIYNLNVELVYDNVHTKIGLNNKSIRSQDIKKLISDVNQCLSLLCKFAKNDNLLSLNVDLVYDSVYTKFG